MANKHVFEEKSKSGRNKKVDKYNKYKQKGLRDAAFTQIIFIFLCFVNILETH